MGQSHQYLNLVDSLTLNPPYAIAGSRLQREPTYLNRYRADNEFYSHDLQTTIPSPLAYLHTACVPDLRECTVSFEILIDGIAPSFYQNQGSGCKPEPAGEDDGCVSASSTLNNSNFSLFLL